MALTRPFRIVRGEATNYRTQYYKTEEKRNEAAQRFADLDGQTVLGDVFDSAECPGAWACDFVARPDADELAALDFDPDPGDVIAPDQIAPGDRITIWAFPQPFGVVGGFLGVSHGAEEHMGVVSSVEFGSYEDRLKVVRVKFEDGREVEGVEYTKTIRHFDSEMKES